MSANKLRPLPGALNPTRGFDLVYNPRALEMGKLIAQYFVERGMGLDSWDLPRYK